MRHQLYWRGVPVPYVALWSSEKYSHIAPDVHAGNMDAIFCSGARGEGEPVWGLMHEPRQRETVALNRCQVCNCKLSSERSFGMDVPQEMVYGGRALPLLREPPACLTCTRYALQHCPGNRRRYEAGVLQCFEIFSFCPTVTLLGKVDGGTPELERLLSPGQIVAGMNKCLLTEFRRLTLRELLSEVKA